MPHDNFRRTTTVRKKKAEPPPRGVTIQFWRGEALQRFAYCPTHGNKTSAEQGVGETDSGRKYVLFRCPQGKDHTSHIFSAEWPANEPAAASEIEAWKAKERQNEIKEMEGGA